MLGNHHPNKSNATNLSSDTHFKRSPENSDLDFSAGPRNGQKPQKEHPDFEQSHLYQATFLPKASDLNRIDEHRPKPEQDEQDEQDRSSGKQCEQENGSLRDEADVTNAELVALGLVDASLSVEKDDFSSQHLSHSMEFASQVWRNALSELAMSMPPATYNTWMKDTQVLGYEDGEFIIGAPNAYACDWIKDRLRGQIKRTLSQLLQRQSIQVTFRVAPPTIENDSTDGDTPLYDGTNAQPDVVTPDSQTLHQQKDGVSPSPLTTALGSELAAEDTPSRHIPQNGVSLPKVHYPERASVDKHRKSVSIKLNAAHTFDTFVVGKHNRMAHAAAEAISDNPGSSFNPLFVYGGVGLGKTHLLHAIGNRAIQKGFNILYCTSEQFTNELILAIRNQSTEYFRNKYRQVDILLIDDIQFISGKESTQEEFFHTFNHLHASGKQVILSSDRPPKALPTLEERLRSRFEGGLQTDISKPDFETRVAILQSKAATAGMGIDTAALMLIAERVDSNIRELEGALNRIVHQAKFFSNRLDVELTEAVLKNLAPERTLRTPSAIIQVVAEHYDLAVEDLTGRSRTKDIAHARQMTMYLLREENAMSLPSIGDHLGGRDHSTVRHGVEKISNDVATDENIQSQVLVLRDKIYDAPGI